MASSLNFDNILVFGDSHLAGTDLTENQDEKLELTLTWPNIVAKHFGLDIKNFARGAASNERSLRILPETVLYCKNSFVIYGITDWTRTELLNNKKQYTRCAVGIKNLYKDKDDINNIKLYNDHILERRVTELNNNNYLILNHLIYVQSFLKLYAKNYCFFPISETSLSLNNKKSQKIIFSAIDQEKIFKNTDNGIEFNSWVNWGRKNNYPIGRQKHFLHKAHNDFAQIFIEYINRLYDLNY